MKKRLFTRIKRDIAKMHVSYYEGDVCHHQEIISQEEGWSHEIIMSGGRRIIIELHEIERDCE